MGKACTQLIRLVQALPKRELPNFPNFVRMSIRCKVIAAFTRLDQPSGIVTHSMIPRLLIVL